LKYVRISRRWGLNFNYLDWAGLAESCWFKSGKFGLVSENCFPIHSLGRYFRVNFEFHSEFDCAGNFGNCYSSGVIFFTSTFNLLY